MVKRARLIYNPTSGREEMRRRLPDVLQRLETHGFETSTHATIGEGDAALAAAEASRRGFDVIIAAGGDGTLNEVFSGLAELEYRPPVGVMPLGTTNDLARALGIPRSWDAAIDLIAEGVVRPIDIGQVNHRYFMNIAGGGSLTELTYEVPSKMKTMLGQLAYYMKGFEKLPRLRPIRMKVTADEVQLNEEFMIFLIANSNSVGGFEKLAPDALIDDGYMDAFFLRRCTLADFIRLASVVVRGDPVDDPLLVQFRTKRICIESEDYVQLNLDGEFGGTLPADIRVLPRHIGVFVDPTGRKSYHRQNGAGHIAAHTSGTPGSAFTMGSGSPGGVISTNGVDSST
ncbi:diacylglycerol kinase [Paenibacillus sp. TRM 82003]|nr:diacylglycerol kinase [Paenibacillus sp. TRM 82003]